MTLKLLKKLRSLSVMLSIIDEEVCVTAVAHEEVVGNGHRFKLDHFLIYNRDAKFQSLLWCQMVIGNSVEDDCSLVRSYCSGDSFNKSGFPRAIFSDQRVNLTLAETDGYIVQRSHARVAFGNVV